jgi:hypothetical protein
VHVDGRGSPALWDTRLAQTRIADPGGYRFKVKRITAERGQQLDRSHREWLDEGLDPSPDPSV